MCWYRYGSFHIDQHEVQVTPDGMVDVSEIKYTSRRGKWKRKLVFHLL